MLEKISNCFISIFIRLKNKKVFNIKNKKFLRNFFIVFISFFILIFPTSAKNKMLPKNLQKKPKVYKMRFLKQSELRRIVLKKEYDYLTKDLRLNLSKKDFDFIYKKSVEHHINPILILTRLQIEQSLLLTKHEGKDLKKRLNRACGFGTSIEERTGSKRFWGFKRQIVKCIEFYDTEGDDAKCIKEIQTFDNDHKIIIPLNSITAMLLMYTPRYSSWQYKGHSGIGNKSYIRLYKKWMRSILKYRKTRKDNNKTDIVLYFDTNLKNFNALKNEIIKNDISVVINNKECINMKDIGETNFYYMQTPYVLDKIKNLKISSITNFDKFVFKSFDKTDDFYNLKIATDNKEYTMMLSFNDYKKEFIDYALLKILNENKDETKIILKLSDDKFIENYIDYFLKEIKQFSEFQLTQNNFKDLNTMFDLENVVVKISAIEKIENLD